uniref:Transcriptional regulator n=1 Tax=Meloidogyne hapla TaxID=6305 RepID=A0A1I8BPB2_MELHA
MKSDTFDVLLIGGMTRMPKIQQIVKQIFGKKPYVPEVVTYCDRVVAVKDETTSFRDGTIMDKDGLITCGGICLGVHSGDINFVNGRRITSKNLAKASQELYYARKYDCRGSLGESVSYIIKEFYSKIHIDVKSDVAVERLGFFLDQFHKKDLKRLHERSSFFDVYDLFIPGARAIDDYYGDRQEVTRDLCDSTFKFMKDFPMNNKNLLSVKAALMPYLLGIKNFEKERDFIRREYKTIKFKRINKNINVRHLLKKYIFKNKQCKRRKQKRQKLLLFETFEEIAVKEKR